MSQGLATLFQENEEDDVEVALDVGAPVTEGKKWGLQEKAFDELIVDDEKIEMKKQKKKGNEQQKYVSGIQNRNNTSQVISMQILQVNFPGQGL